MGVKLSFDKKAFEKAMKRRLTAMAEQMRDSSKDNIQEGVDGQGHRFAPIVPRPDGTIDRILHPTERHLLPSMKAAVEGKKAVLKIAFHAARDLYMGRVNMPARRYAEPGRNMKKILDKFQKG